MRIYTDKIHINSRGMLATVITGLNQTLSYDEAIEVYKDFFEVEVNSTLIITRHCINNNGKITQELVFATSAFKLSVGTCCTPSGKFAHYD